MSFLRVLDPDSSPSLRHEITSYKSYTLNNKTHHPSYDNQTQAIAGFDFGKIGIQPKLKISNSGDEYERDADMMAERVVNMPATSRIIFSEPNTDHGFWTGRRASYAHPLASREVASLIASDGGRPLDTHVRESMESRFGHGFGNVKIHTGERAAKSAQAIGALAYTLGNHVVFASNQYSPSTPDGTMLLAHELAHVVQQSHVQNLMIQRRSRVSETGDLLEWWDSSSDAVDALNLLAGMNTTDFNDTIHDMVSSGQVVRLVNRLPSRSEVIRFLNVLADKGTHTNQDEVMNAIPFFNLSGENQLIVFGRRFVPSMGARGAPPPSSLSSLVSSNPSAPFTGGGATGTSAAQSPMGLMEMWNMRSQSREARERFGSGGIEHAQYIREPGLEMLYDWSNPIKGALVGPGSYLDTLTPVERQGQAQLLFGQQIATSSPAAYAGSIPTRIQVIRAAAAEHRLEPQLVAAIILAEQRDQSRREDAADYQGATVGGRSTSIGLGQVTVRTARQENLFGDLTSSSMQRFLGSNTDFSNDMIARLLASDEFNIFAVARYLRIVANLGATKTIGSLPNTQAWVGPIDLARYSGHSSTWTREHIRLIGSEYTSRPFDDALVVGWGDFVLAAYDDVRASGIF